jgi:hypothetical protein
MAAQVTITIPDALYQRARVLARRRRRPLDTIIADALDRGLATEPLEDEVVMDSSFATDDEVGERLARETAAYKAMHEELMADHAGHYVAVFNGRLVDFDSDETALLRRIEATYPDDIVLMKRVMPLPEREFWIRSPRLER